MIEELPHLPAQTLNGEDYRTDFKQNFTTLDESLKLERQEWFREPDVESWNAMNRGDWDTALRLIDRMRPQRAKLQQELNARGFIQRRVRFVTTPLTEYLRWELRALRLWAELGEQITTLPTEAVQHLETTGPLPEIVILGGKQTRPVMYQILYRQGVLDGARKFTDPDLTSTCREEITSLWRQGENLLTYPKRSIDRPDNQPANLPPLPRIRP